MSICPICDSQVHTTVFVAHDQPLARYGLCKTIDETTEISGLSLDIRECDVCGFLFNESFSYEDVDYNSDNIQESRVFSPTIRKHMENAASTLANAIELKNETIVEIGCGEGFFLSQFSAGSKCIGFEPSPEGLQAAKKNIDVIAEYYDLNKLYEIQPKLIILRQVLEHLKNPSDYISSFATLLRGSDSQSYIYIEVPNGSATRLKHRFQDLYYEHYAHYSMRSLTHLLEKNGFVVLKCQEALDGEILSIFAKVVSIETESTSFEDERDYYQYKIKTALDSGKKIVAWGSAGNGCSFLNLCGFSADQIPYVVDSDERKQNLFIPGTGQRVVAPVFLKEYMPDTILILSQFHKKDITDNIHSLLDEQVEILTVGEETD